MKKSNIIIYLLVAFILILFFIYFFDPFNLKVDPENTKIINKVTEINNNVESSSDSVNEIKPQKEQEQKLLEEKDQERRLLEKKDQDGLNENFNILPPAVREKLMKDLMQQQAENNEKEIIPLNPRDSFVHVKELIAVPRYLANDYEILKDIIATEGRFVIVKNNQIDDSLKINRFLLQNVLYDEQSQRFAVIESEKLFVVSDERVVIEQLMDKYKLELVSEFKNRCILTLKDEESISVLDLYKKVKDEKGIKHVELYLEENNKHN